jgi:hypothetical protein
LLNWLYKKTMKVQIIQEVIVNKALIAGNQEEIIQLILKNQKVQKIFQKGINFAYIYKIKK